MRRDRKPIAPHTAARLLTHATPWGDAVHAPRRALQPLLCRGTKSATSRRTRGKCASPIRDRRRSAEDPPRFAGLVGPAESACRHVVGRLEERNARRRRAAVVEAPRGVRSGVRDVAALGAVAAGSKVVRREPDAAALQEGEATRGRGGGQGAPVRSWRCGGKGKASGGEAGSAPVDEVVWKGVVGAQAAVLAVAPRAACEEGSEKGPRQPPAAAAAAPPPSPASFDDVHRLGEDQPVLPPRVAA